MGRVPADQGRDLPLPAGAGADRHARRTRGWPRWSRADAAVTHPVDPVAFAGRRPCSRLTSLQGRGAAGRAAGACLTDRLRGTRGSSGWRGQRPSVRWYSGRSAARCLCRASTERSSGVPTAVAAGARWCRPWPREPAVQGAALLPLVPVQVPVTEAVAERRPSSAPCAVDDLDERRPRWTCVEEPLGVRGAHAGAAVADVGVAPCEPTGPGRGVHVLTAPGHPGGLVDRQVVRLDAALGDADSGARASVRRIPCPGRP